MSATSGTPNADAGGYASLHGGGRITHDSQSVGLGNAPLALLPPPEPHQTWRALDLDAHALQRVSASKLVELMADTSPEFGRATDDFLRLINPGWAYKAFAPGTTDELPRARAIIDAFLARLRGYYGSVDVPINRNVLALYLRGAWFGELVMGSDRRTAIDLATPDPASVRFRVVQDPERGAVHQVGQWVLGDFVPLDLPTVKYIPHDPFPGSPYGRSPAAPGIFGALFLMGFLRDIRRVIAQQGYPRIHISLNLKRMIEMMPRAEQQNDKKIQEYGARLMETIKREYARLQPDDAYVHSDVVTIDRPVGTLDASSLGMIDKVIDILERMLVRALKTVPLLFGITEGTTETNANRQWEIMAARIKALQHLCESPMEDLLTYALRAEGINAVVEWRFSELRSAEALRDAQIEWQTIMNERQKYNAGWSSQDQAAQALGYPDPDEQEPRDGMGLPAQPATASSQPEPGVNRALGGDASQRERAIHNFAQLTDAQFRGWCDAQRVCGTMTEREIIEIARARSAYIGQRETLTPIGAGDDFAALPDTVDFSDDDRAALTTAWDATFPSYRGLLTATVTNADETA